MGSRRHSAPETKPRKKPHCKKCGELMQGHKRRQCKVPTSAIVPRRRKSLQSKLTKQFSQLSVDDNIDKPEKQTSEPKPVGTRLVMSESMLAQLDFLARPGMLTTTNYDIKDINDLPLRVQPKWDRDVANVFKVETGEVAKLIEDAKARGLFGRASPSDEAETDWLILGKDETMVNDMSKQIDRRGYTFNLLSFYSSDRCGLSSARAYIGVEDNSDVNNNNSTSSGTANC